MLTCKHPVEYGKEEGIKTKFVKLFEPGRIGKLEVKNRIVFAPMVTRFVTEDGGITDQLVDYYVERARGGAGLIVTEAAYPRSTGYQGRIFLNNDSVLPGLRKLVEAIHKAQAKVICEINVHRGRVDEFDPASASPVSHPVTGIVARQLSIEDIRKLVADFGDGVRRAREAGYDGIMIHGATGYLVSEFLSPLVNKRTDEYGTDFKGRARLLLELVEAAKKYGGSDYPIVARITADEKLEGGFGVTDAIALCKMLQEAGVNAVDVTVGSQETVEWTFPSMYMPPGCNVGIAEAIKRQLEIPVWVAGKINDPYQAEEILQAKRVDFVDMGRALLADPFLPKKAMEDRVDDICPCITCQRCMEAITMRLEPVECTVNPTVGREREFESKLKPAKERKKVLVIGGGPGGMEAANIAAQRGHDVTLWEAGEKLGGQLNLAVVPPGKGDLNKLTNYLQSQLAKLEVTIELGKKATLTAVREFAPDAVVVATGSIPFIPGIPGATGESVASYQQVLSGEKMTGDRVVVVGGGLIGCETADFLAEQGKRVVVTFPEEAPITLEVVARTIRKVLLERLEGKKVSFLAGVKLFKEITREGIKLVDKEGNEVLLEADSIVFATGASPDRTLDKALKGEFPNLYEVGDCVEARRLIHAIHEGAEVALHI